MLSIIIAYYQLIFNGSAAKKFLLYCMGVKTEAGSTRL